MDEKQKQKLAACGVPAGIMATAEAKGFSFVDILTLINLAERYGPAIKDLFAEIVSIFSKK